MAKPLPWLKPGIFAGSLAPAGALAWRGLSHDLGANPIAEALNQLGLTALIFLIATLACTPLKLKLGWTWPPRVRRMLGLFAFAYASAHFLTYVAVDQVFDFKAIIADIIKRNFILVGFLALVLMIPLAVTSTDTMVRRLGFPAWKRVHRLAYVAGMLGVVHFVWRVKKDLTEPAIYGLVLGVLLAIRVWEAGRKAWRNRPRTQETDSPPTT